jgi:hypothetical protein
MMLAAVAGTLRAEVSIGGLADMAIIPYQFILNEDTLPQEESSVSGAGAGRIGSGQGPRARLDLRASKDGIIGMRARIQARTDGIGIEDYLQAWWRPLPWLRIDAGRFLDDRLRGAISDDEKWNAYTVRMYDGDAIFSRFKTHWTGQAGLLLSFAPLEELYIGAMLYGLSPFTASSSGTGSSALFDAHPDYVTDNAGIFNRIQAAAAWTIKDTALIRVQYLGAKPAVEFNRVTDEIMDDSNNLIASYDFYTFSITAPKFEAAIAFTGFPGLTVDIGGKIPLPFKEWTLRPENVFLKEDDEELDVIYKTYKSGFIWQAPYQVAAGARYQWEALELAGRLDAKFGGSIKGHAQELYPAPELNFHFWPSYDLGFAKVCLDFGYEYTGAALDKNGELIGTGTPRAMNGGSRIGLGISLQKNIFTGCLVKGGFAYKFSGTVNGVREKAVFTVPLYLEYSF